MAQESTHELQFSDSQTFFYCEMLVYRYSFANKAFHGTLLYKYGFLWLQIFNTVAKCGVHKVMADVRVAMFTFTSFSELNRWMVCLSVEWSSSEFTIALQQQQLEVVNDFTTESRTNIGIKGSALQLFDSYLSDWFQFV